MAANIRCTARQGSPSETHGVEVSLDVASGFQVVGSMIEARSNPLLPASIIL